MPPQSQDTRPSPVTLVPASGPQKEDAPGLSFKALKACIPKHCFQRNTLVSLNFLLHDVLETALWIALHVIVVDGYIYPISTLLGMVASALCIAMQGTVMTGLWVLSHECGHGAFSPYIWVSDTVGFIFHTMLFAPYFSWQKSHGNHHSWTGNLQHDEVWVPSTVIECEKTAQDIGHMTENYGQRHWIYAAFDMLVLATVGWPFYLAFNVSGHKVPDGQVMSHFVPSSPIFKGTPAWKVHLSTAGIVAWVAVLYHFFDWFGVSLMMRIYVLPLSIVFFLLTGLTFLQHTDEKLPFWNDGDGWSWIKGATQGTIDRSMGEWMDRRLHYITSTHVCHHMFSKIPFYHAREATAAISKELGPLYRKSDSETLMQWLTDLFCNLRDCNAMTRRSGKPDGMWWFKTSQDVKITKQE